MWNVFTLISTYFFYKANITLPAELVIKSLDFKDQFFNPISSESIDVAGKINAMVILYIYICHMSKKRFVFVKTGKINNKYIYLYVLGHLQE